MDGIDVNDIDRKVFTGQPYKNLPVKVDILQRFLDATSINHELTFGQFLHINGIDRNMLISDAPQAVSSLKPYSGYKEVSTALNVLNKHLHHRRGKTLEGKLDVLNDYLLKSNKKTFGDYLSDKQIPKAAYMAGLPDKYKEDDIFTMSKDDLLDYVRDLNGTYFNQFTKFAGTAPEGISGKKIMREFKKNVDGSFNAAGAPPTRKLGGGVVGGAPIVNVGGSVGAGGSPSVHPVSPNGSSTGGTTKVIVGGGKGIPTVGGAPTPNVGGTVTTNIPPNTAPPIVYPTYPYYPAPATTSSSGGSSGGGDSSGGSDSGSDSGSSTPDTTPTTDTTPFLSYGDSNQYVIALQQALGVPQTGTFDGNTLYAVQQLGYSSPLSQTDYNNIINYAIGQQYAQQPMQSEYGSTLSEYASYPSTPSLPQQSSASQQPSTPQQPATGYMNYGDSNSYVASLQKALGIAQTGTFDNATLQALQKMNLTSPLSQSDYNTVIQNAAQKSQSDLEDAMLEQLKTELAK